MKNKNKHKLCLIHLFIYRATLCDYTSKHLAVLINFNTVTVYSISRLAYIFKVAFHTHDRSQLTDQVHFPLLKYDLGKKMY